ncbi:hypothetical protein V9T40_006878 [Parthenolecanium corni]|uniref:Uncharacterized protein n=1 Tax=Parthenolecanium corni TaxID=536013 RepID=A0AAN9TPJ7_9HEMI
MVVGLHSFSAISSAELQLAIRGKRSSKALDLAVLIRRVGYLDGICDLASWRNAFHRWAKSPKIVTEGERKICRKYDDEVATGDVLVLLLRRDGTGRDTRARYHKGGFHHYVVIIEGKSEGVRGHIVNVDRASKRLPNPTSTSDPANECEK